MQEFSFMPFSCLAAERKWSFSSSHCCNIRETANSIDFWDLKWSLTEVYFENLFGFNLDCLDKSILFFKLLIIHKETITQQISNFYNI